ncbi:hypothetical protein [Embleya sp. NBC_00896]|uniref:hypothetical protein n=1 Tax=Embleya sp. NBC_00896 TaxID=2975961 RepID=UPI0038633238|nr:hypothetical protein OG928_12715 [Embleya sp. NBC_00896]
MAVSQRIDTPTAVENPEAAVSARFDGLSGCAFEAAVRYAALPPGTPLTIATIRELIRVGAHVAARVLRELTEAGIAAAKHLRDSTTGRMVGRLTEWSGPRAGEAAPAPPAAGPEPEPEPADPAVRALALLRSLAEVDDRLAFKDRELHTLVPFLAARLTAGESEAEVFRQLTEDLPPEGRVIRTGLLHYRLNKAPKRAPVIPAQSRRPRLVECADCGRPGPDLVPGDLCRRCRTGTEPTPLDALARSLRLRQLLGHAT